MYMYRSWRGADAPRWPAAQWRCLIVIEIVVIEVIVISRSDNSIIAMIEIVMRIIIIIIIA